MEAGLNLYSIRNLIGTEDDLVRTAVKLREMGYAYLQYSGAPFEPERIRRASEVSGLPVLLTHVPMERILHDTDALMRDHEVFGCRAIGLGAMPAEILFDDAAFRATVEALDHAAARMAQNGFAFFYHHHHFEFMKRGGATLLDYIRENAPHVSLTADTYWMQYGGADILATLEKWKGRVACVHLKDYRVTAEKTEEGKIKFKPDFAPVGEGTLDFPAIVAKMRACGTRRFFVEQDNAAQLPDPLSEVERSIRYIREKL